MNREPCRVTRIRNCPTVMSFFDRYQLLAYYQYKNKNVGNFYLISEPILGFTPERRKSAFQKLDDAGDLLLLLPPSNNSLVQQANRISLTKNNNRYREKEL